MSPDETYRRITILFAGYSRSILINGVPPRGRTLSGCLVLSSHELFTEIKSAFPRAYVYTGTARPRVPVFTGELFKSQLRFV